MYALVSRLHIVFRLSSICLWDRERWGEREVETGRGGRGRWRQRSGTPSASILCLPRPSPYGSSHGMRLGTTSDSTLITNEDTMFVLFSLLLMCMFVSFLFQNVPTPHTFMWVWERIVSMCCFFFFLNWFICVWIKAGHSRQNHFFFNVLINFEILDYFHNLSD